jgi:uncharacterized protein YfiM (DUF2279 family)
MDTDDSDTYVSLAPGDVSLLEADPPNTYMSIRGPISVSGVAPLGLDELPVGEYYLSADGPGLPAIRGRFARYEDGIFGRPWAGPTSLVLPPGFVHLERGEKRGWWLMGTGTVGGTMAIVSQASVRNAQGKRELAANDYNRAVSQQEIKTARLELLAATWEKRDYEEVRNLWIGYFVLTWLGSGVECLFLTPQPHLAPTVAGQYVASFPRAGGAKAALRSALFPGAGQRYMGRSGRANFFFAATAILAAGAIAAQDRFLESRRDQAAAQWRFDHSDTEEDLRRNRDALHRASDDVEDKNTVRWALAGLTAGAYLWNVLDAFGLGQQAKYPDLALSVAPAQDGVSFCATWSIP